MSTVEIKVHADAVEVLADPDVSPFEMLEVLTVAAATAPDADARALLLDSARALDAALARGLAAAIVGAMMGAGAPGSEGLPN